MPAAVVARPSKRRPVPRSGSREKLLAPPSLSSTCEEGAAVLAAPSRA
jgi:hypothetical protein